MPKYWVKNYFAHGRFPEVGRKQKTEGKKRKEEEEEERLNDGDNKGQATFGLFLSVFCFRPTSGNLPCAKICFPQYFGITRSYEKEYIFVCPYNALNIEYNKLGL